MTNTDSKLNAVTTTGGASTNPDSKPRVFSLHLLDGYFIEEDMGGDLGKNILRVVDYKAFHAANEKVERLQKDIEFVKQDLKLEKEIAAKMDAEWTSKIARLEKALEACRAQRINALYDLYSDNEPDINKNMDAEIAKILEAK
jgi:LPS O-antigen subunit length determinant protein (WzzB/FepE family)